MPSDLNPADAGFAARLADALGPDRVRPPEPRHLEEPRGRLQGRAAAVVLPRSTDELAAAVRLCAASRVGIVPYAGGTGLVGGQVATDGPAPVILSVERLVKVREVNTDDDVAVAEAGVILADLQAAARDAGRLFPLSLAAEGTCRIGGNLATNAGGLNVLRYGNSRDLCLGIEAVMADGSVLHGLSRLRKDNTGYDLRHLLIGSEGTLGIITAASLRLFPLPEDAATAFVAVPSPAAAIDLLHALQARLGGAISAFELMQGQGHRFLAEQLPGVALPFPGPPDWTVLVEATGGRDAGLGPALEAGLADALESGRISDALIAQNAGQRAAFWSVREHIPEANRRVRAISHHDLAVPLSRIGAFVEAAPARLAAIAQGLRINCFGHLGDGNLHYNVFAPEGRDRSDYDTLGPRITETVHDLVHELGGSVSAEHGIGRIKAGDLARYGDPAELAAMRAIKQALDPLGILNPGALFA
jgi:FAD/FMN-containing dehydrogenase